MNRHIARLLALLLTASMLLGYAPRAQAEHIGGTPLSWKQADMELMTAHRTAGEGLILPEQPEYEDTRSVRVSILLEGEAPIEQSSLGLMSREDFLLAIHDCRERLYAQHQIVEERIAKEVLGGKALDVVQELTLMMNAISANVCYGDIEKIRQIEGVRDVVLEALYPPAECDKDGPYMAAPAETTGARSAWSRGYTGAGRRVAVIDTGLDITHQSFDRGAFLHAIDELLRRRALPAANI